MQQMMIYW